MKKFLVLFLSLFSFSLVAFPLSAKADEFSVAAKSSIAVDAASGKILYAQNADDSSTQIASITKLLTAYLVYKNVDEGKLKWTDKAKISQYAYQLTQDSNASNIPLTLGQELTIKDLTNALLLPSANSAAIALAEKIAGSEPKFVDMMTAQLKTWGITNAKLVNSSGLPNDLLGTNIYPGSGQSDTNRMSAKDVAILSFHLIKDYPEILEITKQFSLPFDQGGPSETTLQTTNQMLKNFSNYRIGVDGLKTGSTGLQVDCLAATTVQNNFRIITVVLEATAPAADNTTPFTLTNQLMNEVYGTWTLGRLASKGATFKGFENFSVVDGKKDAVPLIAQKDITPVVPIKNSNPDLSVVKISAVTNDSNSVVAPVTKDQALVTIHAKISDSLGYLTGNESSTFQLVAKNEVQKANPFAIFWNHFVKFVNEKL